MSRSDSIPRHARHSFYTYLHRRLDSGLVFYVGKGTRTRGASTSGRSEHWRRVVNKCGYSIEVAGVWASEDEAFSHERLLISVFRDLGHPLINKTDGGEGAGGMVATDETKAKMVAAFKALRDRDPDFDSRRVAAIIKAKQTEEGRKTHSAAMRAHRSTEFARARQSEVSKEAWSNPELRARRIQGMAEGKKRLGRDRIAAAARMKFEDQEKKARCIAALLELNKKNRKPVKCVTTGEVFESILAAALALGVNRSCVVDALNGRQKTVKGVVLRYKNE